MNTIYLSENKLIQCIAKLYQQQRFKNKTIINNLCVLLERKILHCPTIHIAKVLNQLYLHP
jgi:hypothetical protein